MNLSRLIEGEEAAFSQVAMVVPDVDAAVAAQLAIANCGPFSVWEYAPDFFPLLRYRGEDSPISFRVAINAREPAMEFVQVGPGPSVYQEHVEQSGYGLHHVAYQVAEIEPIRAGMEAAGYEVAQETGGWGRDGDGLAYHFDTRAAIGCWTEVTQPAKERRPPSQVTGSA